MSAASEYEATAQDALAEARQHIPTPDDWDPFNPSQQADLERGRLAQTTALVAAVLAVAERIGELVTEQRVVNLVACRSYGLYTASHIGADQIDNRIDEYLTAAFQSEGVGQ